ncbi:hypothetical protein J6590_048519 [Homalodisca vitripennis]|nr:hypothetical protein J6590_048519 [Homalodisca vitripennis]
MAMNLTTCRRCMKIVLDSEDGIQCDSRFGGWFHRGCVDVSKNEYSQYMKDVYKKWNCNRVDCKPHTDNPIIALTLSVNKLMDKVELVLDDKPRPLKVTFKDATGTITFFKAFNSDLLVNSFPNCVIDISHDCTPMERENLQKLKVSLAAREEAGKRISPLSF